MGNFKNKRLMATRTLIILGLYVLCNSFTCEPCRYNRLPDGGPTLEIERELETAGYVVGDTVWLNAEFGTEQNADGVSYSITEAGGLVLSRLVSYTPNSDTVVSARDAFSVIAVGGEVTEEVDGSDGSLILTRVGCSDGLCTFRQGYRLERPGSYLIITEGSSLSIVDPDFDLCGLHTNLGVLLLWATTIWRKPT